MSKNKQIRSRNFMYEQQISHLPNNMTADDIYNHVEQELKPKRMACVLHNKDLQDDNKTPAEDHIHMMIQFENPRSVKQVAKEIGDNPQQLVIWKGSVENGFSYLIHATDNSRHKHQYSCDEVRANFDYSALIARIAKKVSKLSAISNAKRINGMLDLVGAGEMSFQEARNRLSGSEYANAGEKFKRAHELYLERCSEKMRKQMIENNEMVAVHWFFGETETGKTHLAELLAEETGLPYYKTTTAKDPFQFYQAQHTIILDELRPEQIPYSELLALLNPFSRGKVEVSSRFYNKALSCNTIYITTPYNPVAFYMGYKLSAADKGEQLFRRLSSVLMFDLDYIYRMEYKDQNYAYLPVDKKTNKYSKKNQAPYTLHNIFDKIS